MAAACFFERSQCAKSHGIVDCRDKSAFGWRSPQILADGIQAVFKLTFSVKMRHGTGLGARQYLRQAGHSARDAQLRQRCGYRQFKKQQRLDVASPVFFCPAA